MGRPPARSAATRPATSVLKAAAFALGYVGPDQAKEEIHVHQQLRDLYAGYGFVPHYGQQSFLVPLATAHLPAFEPQGRGCATRLRQKMTAHADRFDPDEADWIARRARPAHQGARHAQRHWPAARWCRCPMLGELIDLQRNMEVFAVGRGAGGRAAAERPHPVPEADRRLDRVLGRRGRADHREPADDRQPRPAGEEARRVREAQQRAAAVRQSRRPRGWSGYDMARVAALKADLAMLEGTGGTQIKGLLTYSRHHARTRPARPGANGDTFQAAGRGR